ncbi:GNAT family N-acetyltransferase [Paenibacillus sp. Z6-24]
MIQIRRVHTHELAQAAELANDIFCEQEYRHMETSFPTLFHPGISHSYGAFTEQNRLVSFMGLVPVKIRSGQQILSAFSIGAVCTHPDYRGQRLAGQLLERCRQHATESGASLMFISGDRSLYTRAGSQFFGQIHQAAMSSNTLSSWGPFSWEMRDMRAEDIFAVHALLQSRPAYVQMSLAELQQMIEAAPMAHIRGQHLHIRVATVPGQRSIEAVSIFSIPEEPSHSTELGDSIPERSGQALEWAGPHDAVMALWQDAVSVYALASLTAPIPWQETSLIQAVKESGAALSIIPNGGTVMIASGSALISQIELLDDLAPDAPVRFSVESNNQYILHTPQGTCPVDGDAELCSLLFDPSSSLLQNQNIPSPAVTLPYMYGLYFI